MYKGKFVDVVIQIANDFKLGPNRLLAYTQEAPYAAKRPDGHPWPSGTGSENEKRILYAITKALQPETVIDVGTRWGSMTLQILSASPKSRVISIDIEKTIHGGGQPVGRFIPKQYEYEQLFTDATRWFAVTNEQANLIFEDTAHNEETTYGIYKRITEILTPGGVVISHDAAHPKFKGAVVNGIRMAGIEPNVYLVEGDSCGLAIWRKPESDDIKPVQIETVYNETEVDTEASKEEPERRKRRRKKASKMTAIEDV